MQLGSSAAEDRMGKLSLSEAGSRERWALAAIDGSHGPYTREEIHDHSSGTRAKSKFSVPNLRANIEVDRS